MLPTLRTARFLTAYVRGGVAPITVEELRVPIGGEEREATLYLPPRGRRPVPGWVVLHGLTVPGRHHRAMTRFVRSVAAAGAAVLVPDVPSWRDLRLDLAAARDTLVDGGHWLASRPEVQAPVGAVGFSFGATQALMALADPEARRDVGGVVSFGGYCDVERMVRCLFTGEHDWQGVHQRVDPDPYGRWIMVGNYLTRVPGCEHMHEAAQAARALALEAGRRGAFAWEAEYDEMKRQLRDALPREQQEVWDLVAPPTSLPVEPTPETLGLASAFAGAVLRADPGLDPRPLLPALRGRIVLSHGRADRLIPYTETLRLREMLPPQADVSTILTGLFAHSMHAGLRPLERAREAAIFIRLLNEALYVV